MLLCSVVSTYISLYCIRRQATVRVMILNSNHPRTQGSKAYSARNLHQHMHHMYLLLEEIDHLIVVTSHTMSV
jgi:hypothetical protein